MLKVCGTCRLEKPLVEFYRAKKYTDGRQTICKACAAEYRRKYAKNNRGKINSKSQRWRQKPGNKDKCKEWIGRNRDYYIKRAEEYRELNPEKVLAHARVSYALKTGKIKKMPCERCGSPRSQGHHEDYSKPLDVVWLCQVHHIERHKQILMEVGFASNQS